MNRLYVVAGSSCRSRVARAHVDRGLADLADARRDRDHARDVVVVREVVRRADGVQITGRARRWPSRRRSRAPAAANAAAATPPAPCAVSVMNRRRVTVSPSKAPGICGRRCTWTWRLASASARVCSGNRAGRLPPGRSAGRQSSARAGALRRPRGQRPDRGREASPPSRSDAARAQRRRRIALGVGLGAERDDVGELGHGVEVAERGQPLEPERVQPVAGQQREVGVLGRTTRPVA